MAMRALPQSPSWPTPLARALAIVRALDPVRLAQVLLDFTSVVGSQLWDGRRTGPDFVSPMTSLTKLQSGHLAKLVLRYSRNLNVELSSTDASRQDTQAARVSEAALESAESHAISESQPLHPRPQAVAILDLHDVPRGHRESWQYTTSADIDLMVLVPILLCLLLSLRTGQWSPFFEFIVIDFVTALILGPGTLTLIRRTSTHPTELDPGPGCAVLMDGDLTVVIQGSQRIVEAITEGGFYLSFANPKPQKPTEDQPQATTSASESGEEVQLVANVLYGVLEGGCRGACEAIVMRFLHLNFAIPYLRQTAFVVVFGRMIVEACWWGLRASASHSLPQVDGVAPLRLVARLTGEFLGLLVVAACFTSESSSVILLYGVSFFAQSFYFGLFARLVLQSQNYRVRTERFLQALPFPVDRPPIRRWAFRTRASAATFVCLVLCRDMPRPVRIINVAGVLDTLIPNQRDIWSAWKSRVADRIVHEDRIDFAPTIPTFPDDRQWRLKLLLDEAQSAYQTYARLPPRCSESML